MGIVEQKNLNIFNSIERSLQRVASKNGIEWNESFLKWELKSDQHDFSTSLPMIISFRLGKDRKSIFFELKESVKEFSDYVELLESEKGYLNFILRDEFYREFLFSFMENPFPLCYDKKDKFNVEFVSVNPTGYLHLGHFRNALIGDAIANIYKFIGFRVFKEYYVNDRGKQIDNLAKSVIFNLKNYSTLSIPICTESFDQESLYYGRSIEEVCCYLENETKNGNFSTSQITLDSTIFKEKIVKFFVSKIKLDLEIFDIHFDKWFSEKFMYSNKEHIEKKLNLILESDNSYKKDGAIFLKTSIFGDEKDRVIIKENGDFTYFLSDILYHIDKLERSNFVINIWGADHHGYLERVKSSLKILSFNDVDKRVKFVLIQMVSLLTPSGSLKKFSKRLGNTVGLEEALRLIKKDQLRFSLLETDSNNHLLINVEKLNEEDKKSKLYYIQYAYARCNQIINSWNKTKKDFSSTPKIEKSDSFLLSDKREKKLIKSIFSFEAAVLKSAEEKSPHLILKHIYLLSSDFHSYYQSVPILLKEDNKLTEQRVLLVQSIEKVLGSALKIFSIKPAEFMSKND